MGIDARILLRVKRPIDRAEVRQHALDIAAALGADKFMLNRDRGEQAIDFARRYDGSDDNFYPIRDGMTYQQDGEDIVAAPRETLLEVSVWSRYYGVGYERGDLLFIVAVAEWCERNIESCEVWYGGDSSGVCAAPFDRDARETLLAHFYGESGRDYFANRESIFREPEKMRPDISDCGLCDQKADIRQYGFGRRYAAWYCPSCGLSLETRDGGKTWQEPKKDAS